jgi:hypothetical protein
MQNMVIWAGFGAFVGFLVLQAAFAILVRPLGPDGAVFFVISIMGAIPAAAIGALFAGVNVIQKEMRETRRDLKHWQSVRQMDVDSENPSTHFKPTQPSGDR